MNLVDKAKSFVKKTKQKKVQPDLVELALAWLRGDVTSTQASYAVHGKVIKNTYLVFGNLAKGIRGAYENGTLVIKQKRTKIIRKKKLWKRK